MGMNDLLLLQEDFYGLLAFEKSIRPYHPCERGLNLYMSKFGITEEVAIWLNDIVLNYCMGFITGNELMWQSLEVYVKLFGSISVPKI